MTGIPPIGPSPALPATATDGVSPASKVKKSAADEFMEYQQKSIAEKVRDAILKELGLTEDDIQAMTPAQRDAVEKKIVDRMKEKMKEEITKNADESGSLKGNVLSLLS